MQNPITRITMSCVLVLLLLSACKKSLYTPLKSSVDDVIETAPPVHTAISAKVSDICGGYYEALPTRYDSNSKKYPIILFIHGIGELGNGTTDLKKMVRAGLPRLINKKAFPASFDVKGEHFSFIVVSPQFKKRPTNEEVNIVLDYMVKRYRVDMSRIYVTGLSMGGGVTWEFSSQFGNEVAAIVPICGGSWPDKKRADRIASFDIPVWAFHNADDKTVPVTYTEDYVNMINSHHPTVAAKYTVWPTGGHDSWTKAYNPEYKENGKNMYEWMLEFKGK
jgi:predicted peptidase